MDLKSTKKLLFSAAFIAVAALILLLPLPVWRVCITAVRQPAGSLFPWLRTTLVLPESAAREFVISYTHSVNKGRVYDFYTVLQDGQLCMQKTRFTSYGAGMPEPEDWPDQKFVVADGYYEMQDINRSMYCLTMGVAAISQHAVEINEVTYPLLKFFKSQTRVQIQYRRVSAFQLLEGGIQSLFTTRAQ